MAWSSPRSSARRDPAPWPRYRVSVHTPARRCPGELLTSNATAASGSSSDQRRWRLPPLSASRRPSKRCPSWRWRSRATRMASAATTAAASAAQRSPSAARIARARRGSASARTSRRRLDAGGWGTSAAAGSGASGSTACRSPGNFFVLDHRRERRPSGSPPEPGGDRVHRREPERTPQRGITHVGAADPVAVEMDDTPGEEAARSDEPLALVARREPPVHEQ